MPFPPHTPDASRCLWRKAGSVADFDYSTAVRRSKVLWNAQTLDRWLTDPEKFIPGQKMGYQVPDAADRADIVAYLQRESAHR